MTLGNRARVVVVAACVSLLAVSTRAAELIPTTAPTAYVATGQPGRPAMKSAAPTTSPAVISSVAPTTAPAGGPFRILGDNGRGFTRPNASRANGPRAATTAPAGATALGTPTVIPIPITSPEVVYTTVTPATNNPHWSSYLWAHWWEWNRDDLLQRAETRRLSFASPATQPTDRAAVSANDRSRAIASLSAATLNPSPRVRAEAAIALGRAGQPELLQQLHRLAAADSDDAVRYAACLAVGLLNAKDAQQALLEFIQSPVAHISQQLGAVVGVGVSQNFSSDTESALVALYGRTASRDLRRLILWAGRVHHSSAIYSLATQALASRADCVLAPEAALSLAHDEAGKPSPAIYKLLYATDYGQLSRKTILYPAAGQLEADPNRGPLIKSVALITRGNTYRERELGYTVYEPLLSSAASLALLAEPVTGGDNAALIHRATDTASGDYPHPSLLASDVGPAILAFRATHPTDADLPVLLDILTDRANPADSTAPPNIRSSVRRGFAALALSVPDLLHPAASAPSSALAAAHNRLIDIAAYRSESPDVRAACVLSVGLTGRPEYLPRLQALSRGTSLLARDTDGGFFAAHLLLARALLGDTNVVADAASFFALDPAQLEPLIQPGVVLSCPLSSAVTRKPAPGLTTSLWARRTAMLALSVTRDPRALPVIATEWGTDYWVTLDAARALARCQGYENISALTEILAAPPRDLPATPSLTTAEPVGLSNPDRHERVLPVSAGPRNPAADLPRASGSSSASTPAAPAAELAARTLGELLDPANPSPLATLTTGCLYNQWDAQAWPLDNPASAQVDPLLFGISSLPLRPADPFLFEFLSNDRHGPHLGG